VTPTPDRLRARDSEPTRWDEAGLLCRAASTGPQSYRAEDNSIEIVWSTGARVRRYDWIEERYYDEELDLRGADLSALMDGAPLLKDHIARAETTIGVVIGDTVEIRDLADGRMEGVARVRLSDAESDKDIVGKIRDGIIRGISVGYRVDEWTVVQGGGDGGVDLYRATRWIPREVSATPVQADRGAATRQEATMPDPIQTPVVPAPDPQEAVRAARKAEALRQSEIRRLCRSLNLDLDGSEEGAVKVRSALEDADQTTDQVRALILNVLAERSAKTPIQPARAEVTRDETQTSVRAVECALSQRAGLELTAEERSLANSMRGDTMIDLCKRHLGEGKVRGMSRSEIAQAALHQRSGHVTADFPAIFANVAQKVLQSSRMPAAEYRWFERFARRNDFVNFQPRTIVDMGGIGNLPVVPEGADYGRATFADESITSAAVKYGKEFQLSMEMILNNDLGAFLRIPESFGRSAERTRESIVTGLITGNQVMGDGVVLFHATSHKNLSTSGGAPDLTKIAELDGFLREQTDLDGSKVGMPAQAILIRASYRTGLEQIYSPVYSPTAAANAVTVPFSPENRIVVPSITGSAWYMITGDPAALEYGYLQGEDGPVVERYAEERSESLVYHCRMVFGAKVLDWRAFASNPG